MTSVQLSEWIAFDKLEPIGPLRADINNAHLISYIQNMVNALYTPKGQVPKTINLMDVLIEYDKEDDLEQEQEIPQWKKELENMKKQFGL